MTTCGNETHAPECPASKGGKCWHETTFVPRAGCRLCGQPLAYAGALYCSSACCARWLSGERTAPPSSPSDLDRAKAWCQRLRLGQSDGDDVSLAALIADVRRETIEACAASCRVTKTVFAGDSRHDNGARNGASDCEVRIRAMLEEIK